MKSFIITEGGRQKGFGHVARCLGIYSSLDQAGIEPQFIVNGDDQIKHLLEGVRYEIFDWTLDTSRLLQKISGSDFVLIDSYLADISLYEKIRSSVKEIAVCDDNQRLIYPKCIIINGNAYGQSLNYGNATSEDLLLGPKYVSIRSAFKKVSNKEINDSIGNILITMGGYDEYNVTPRVLKWFVEHYPNARKVIIISPEFDNKDDIAAVSDEQTVLNISPAAADIVKMMSEADVAVSACGQTLYELACVGVPTIGICMADNQLNNLNAWQENGFLSYIGWHHDSNLFNQLQKAMLELESVQARQQRSRVGKDLVDARGAQRIVEHIVKRLDSYVKK